MSVSTSTAAPATTVARRRAPWTVHVAAVLLTVMNLVTCFGAVYFGTHDDPTRPAAAPPPGSPGAWALIVVLVGYALFYWVTGGLVSKGDPVHGAGNTLAQLLQYSLGNMTTVGTGDLDLHPANEAIALVTASQSLVGPVLLGLFGYVLGNKLRR